ncbi:MAG: SLBB domain-containing protein [Chloroflexota bacterium]|nr:SLBB domain-containing protein [Chloroflexota bacterium]
MEILSGLPGATAILLARAGRYDPDGPLVAAEDAGAWSAWKNSVPRLSPQSVLRLVADAGLVGRGGAGHPTAAKWRAAAAQPAELRYVVANGFEADPGAQLDRTLMEVDPHAVVEGVAFAAFAVGARQAFIAVRAGMGVVQRRLTAAILAAEEAGYLGTDALGAGFDVHVEVVPLPGGFVVGEETVLLRAIENKRAQPDQRPPYPARTGLYERPTVVNNVETLAAVPWIVANGANAFVAAGATGQAGTTLVQLTGAVARPGIAEVPLGTAVHDLVAGIGGGTRAGGAIKAVLVGGPTGGFLPAAGLDVSYSAAALEGAGAIVGSGTLVVADESTCLVDMATLMERYLADEACGKTIPCRIGLRRLYEIGERATAGLTRPTDPQLLLDLAADVRDAALCGLERLAPNPLLSGMRYFAEEFEDHFVRGTCPAGVCALPSRPTAPTIRASA